jgi:hypothetical protein
VPKKLPPVDTSLPPPAGEALTTLFNPDMESPRAELGKQLLPNKLPLRITSDVLVSVWIFSTLVFLIFHLYVRDFFLNV